jgi:hypothetical protein
VTRVRKVVGIEAPEPFRLFDGITARGALLVHGYSVGNDPPGIRLPFTEVDHFGAGLYLGFLCTRAAGAVSAPTVVREVEVTTSTDVTVWTTMVSDVEVTTIPGTPDAAPVDVTMGRMTMFSSIHKDGTYSRFFRVSYISTYDLPGGSTLLMAV